MASRRERDADRRRYDDDDRRGGRERRDIQGDYEREDRTRLPDPPRESRRPRGAGLNEFFIDSKGIHREVLQKEICRFLGPEAVSSPKVYKGVDGYLIKAVRPFTQDMLDDLIRISESYVSEREDVRRRGGRGLPYNESEIGRRQDAISQQDTDMIDSDDDYDDDPRPSRPNRGTRDRSDPYDSRITRELEDRYPPRREAYSAASAPSGYGTNLAYANAPPGGVFPGSGFEQSITSATYPYPPVTGYPSTGYPVTSRPGATGPYVYTEAGGNLSDSYRAANPATINRDLPRQQEPREPARYPPGRQEQPRYTGYPVSPPMGRGDTSMGGLDDRYNEYSSGPSVPPRGPYGGRMEPPSYDRPSPDIRDPYRREPAQEERRPRNR